MYTHYDPNASLILNTRSYNSIGYRRRELQPGAIVSPRLSGIPGFSRRVVGCSIRRYFVVDRLG